MSTYGSGPGTPPASSGPNGSRRSRPATTPHIEAGRLWAGAAATAVVAALVAVVGQLVFSVVFDIDPVGPSWLVGDGANATMATRFAVTAAVAALLAAALLHLLLLTTPRPRAFFGTIVSLATVAAAVSPFAVTGETSEQVATAVIVVAVGIAIGSLLSAVARRTVTPPAR